MERAPVDWKRPLWLWLVLLLTFLVYAPSLANGFSYDDGLYVATNGPQANVMVQEVRPLSEYFVRDYGYNGIENTGRGFRPVTVLTFAWIHALTKQKDPKLRTGYRDVAWLQRLVNVLLHVLATWLVFRAIALFTGPGAHALLGTLAFALQPLHSDVVASIVGRGELIPFVCGAAALLFYVRAVSKKGARRWESMAATSVALFFAFCSKESGITWCVFVPLFAWALAWQQDPSVPLFSHLRKQVVTIGAVVLPLAFWAYLYVKFLDGLDAPFEVPYEFNPLFTQSFLERAPTAVMVFGYGIAKVFFSGMLACDYGAEVFPIDLGWGDWRFLLGLTVAMAVLVVGVVRAKQNPLLFLGCAALLGFGFVTSNIPVPIETIFGERLWFTPSIGLSFLVAWFASRRLPGKPVLLGVFALWCLWGAKWCVQRSFHWRSNDTLMLADVEHQPRSLSINKQVAVYYKDKGDEANWLVYQERCLALDPDYIVVLNDLAAHFMQKGDLPRSKAYLDRALAALDLRPRYKTLQGDYVHLNAGRWYLVQGERERAKWHFQQAHQFNDRNPHAREHLLIMAHEDGRTGVAEQLLREFEKYQPGHPALLLHTGLADFRRGDFNGAVTKLHEALYARQQGRNLLNLPAWYALEESLGKLGRNGDRRQLLQQMRRMFPAREHAKIDAKLKSLPK